MLGKKNSIIKTKVLLVAVTTIAFLMSYNFILGHRLWDLNNWLFDGSGDGIKNYYTFCHYYQNGQGHWFTGMLYPYGDLAVYADAQPALVWILWLLNRIGVDLSTHLIALANFLPLLSFPIGSYFIYKIIKLYGCPEWVACIFAVFAMLLCPQLQKIHAHYALSYGLVIPAIWYFAVIVQSQKIHWGIVLLASLASYVTGFIHPYLLLMIAVFCVFWSISSYIVERILPIPVVVVGLTSTLAYLLTIKLIDPYESRPDNPYGIMEFNTRWSDLLPYYRFGWDESGFFTNSGFNEGMAYSSALIFIVPALLVLHFLFNKWEEGQKSNHRSLSIPLITAALALMFAMGMHISLTNGLILELLPPLKQFRGLGRFAWIFYYLSFTALGIIAYRNIEKFPRAWLRQVSYVSVVFVLIFECFLYHSQIRNTINQYGTENTLTTNDQLHHFLKKRDLSPDSFQALITLPQSTEGSEKLYTNTDYYSKIYALPFSLQTGMPLTSSIMSRTPIDNIMSIMQLSNSYYGDKSILNSIEDTRPFLIMINKDKMSLHKDLLSRSKSIGENEHIALYSISKYFLAQERQLTTDIVSNCSNESAIYYNDYSSHQPSIGLLDNTSLFIENGAEWMIDAPLLILDTTQVELSFWYLVQAAKSDVPNFDLTITSSDKSIRIKESFRDIDSPSFEVYDNWVRLKKDLTLVSTDMHINLTVSGTHQYFDHVLLRESAVDHCHDLQGNHFLYNGIIATRQR